MIKKLIKDKSLENKVVMITGTTSGIGKACLTHLARLGCQIIACARNTSLAQTQLETLQKKLPKIKYKIYYLDLQDLQSIEALISNLKTDYPNGIDYLINNAGIFARPITKTKYGFEQHFFTNCIATLFLSKKIIPLLTNNSKIVFVSSISIKNAKINLENIDLNNENKNIKIYANSKLWLTLYLLEWKSKLENKKEKFTIEIVQPGIASTSLMNSKNGSFSKATSCIITAGMKLLFHSSNKASLSEVAGISQTTSKNQWIGPRLFGIWGKPKTKILKLKNANSEIIKKCYFTLENILNNM